MKNFVLLAVAAVALVGCAHSYTPEQLRAMDSAGRDISGVGQALQPKSDSQTCQVVNMGGGIYEQRCN